MTAPPAPGGHTAVLLAAIERLCARLSADHAPAADVAATLGGSVRDDRAPLGLSATPASPVDGTIQTVRVTRQWSGEEVAVVELDLRDDVAIPLEAIEALAGPARRLPRSHPGSPRTVALPPHPSSAGRPFECALLATLRPTDPDDPTGEPPGGPVVATVVLRRDPGPE